MAQKRKNYTAEFKREAVRLVTKQGYSVSEAARNLDVHANLLRKWKNQLEEQGHEAFPGHGHQSPEQEELSRLRRENQRLHMDNTFAKMGVKMSVR